MARTETILTSTEMSELQECWDELWWYIDQGEHISKNDIAYKKTKRIAEILRLEVGDGG